MDIEADTSRRLFEEAWQRQQDAVQGLGWLPLTEQEKKAAWWGWQQAMKFYRFQ